MYSPCEVGPLWVRATIVSVGWARAIHLSRLSIFLCVFLVRGSNIARKRVPYYSENISRTLIVSRDANELRGRGITRRSAQCTCYRSLIRTILAIRISVSQPCRRVPVVNYTCYRSYREIDNHVLEPKGDSLAIRMFIRLVVLHQDGQLTENQWKAISALKSHKESIGKSKELGLPAINSDIQLLREVTQCDMSESDLQDLYWRVNIPCLDCAYFADLSSNKRPDRSISTSTVWIRRYSPTSEAASFPVQH